MFARLDYQAGTPVANLLADIVAVLTGTTDKATLSASIIQNTSYIVADDAAGWSVYDASAGTNKKALSAPNLDGTTKYITIDCNTAGYVLIGVYESWNASTHTGTNPTWGTNDTSVCPTVNLGAGCALFIRAHNSLCIEGYNGAAFNQRNFFVGERDRVEAWDTVAAGYPVVIAGTGSMSTLYSPRTKNTVGDLLNSQASYTVYTPYGWLLPTTQGRDASLNAKHMLVPLMLRQSAGIPAQAGIAHGGIYGTTSSYGSAGDELVSGGDNYFIAANGSTRLAIPKR
jgi:hypothetical protein